LNRLKLNKQLKQFLLEDIGDKDATSQSIFPLDENGTADFIVKEDGVIAGLEIIKETYHLLSDAIEVTLLVSEGDVVSKGEKIAYATGPVQYLLTGERTILNLLQRLSGIASLTRQSVDALNDETIAICDTRKTTPGLRMFEKYAVRVGGGKNHRYGLYDGIMIKDNHIAFAGSIANAVKKVREVSGHMIQVEVETETENDVKDAVAAGADIIMFDNCSPEDIKARINLVPEHITTEASGGITLETLPTYAGSGVDFISLGYLTHSVRSLDISLNVSHHE